MKKGAREDGPDAGVLGLHKTAHGRGSNLDLCVEACGRQVLRLEGLRRRELDPAVAVVQLAQQRAHGLLQLCAQRRRPACPSVRCR